MNALGRWVNRDVEDALGFLGWHRGHVARVVSTRRCWRVVFGPHPVERAGAMVGGTLEVVVFAIFALRASGPGIETPYRSFEGLGVPATLSLLLVVAGFVGLHARLRESYGRLGTVGFILALVGAAVMVVTRASWPVRAAEGLAFTLGSLLVGVAALVANSLPCWGAIALIVGSAAFLLFNTETALAWFALPYGVAWVVVGYPLWSRSSAPTEQPSRVR